MWEEDSRRALRVLAARGPLSSERLVEVLREEAGVHLDPAYPEDELFELFDWADEAALLPDGRWAHAGRLLEGAWLTHRLDAEEREEGAVAALPDLDALFVVDDWLPLEGRGGLERVLEMEGDRVHIDPEWVPWGGAVAGPEGWLEGWEAGSLLGFRLRDRRVEVGAVEVTEEATERAVGALRAAYQACRRPPVYLPLLVLGARAADPGAFAEPAVPVGELLERAGLQMRGEDVLAAGEEWPEPPEWDPEELFAAVHGLDEGGLEGFRILAGALDLFVRDPDAFAEASPDELAGTLGNLGEIAGYPGVAELFAVQEVGWDPEAAEEAAAFVEVILPHARHREDAAACRFLLARCAEAREAATEAEEHLREAVRLDPALEPALADLAWYLEDRGDARRALGLLERAGIEEDDPQRARLEHFAEPPEVSRNDPCRCGSGRKFKACCLPTGGWSLAERSGWLYDKARTYLQRGPHRYLMLGLAAVFTGQDTEHRGTLEAALWDPLVADVALFEEGALEAFLADRGELLPEDEAELLEEWVGTPLRLWEASSVQREVGMGLRDTRTGETVVVTERLGTHDLEPGDLLLARVLPDGGGGHRLFGAPLRMGLQHREPLLGLLDGDPDGFAVLDWMRGAFSPPHLTNREGEDLVACRAVWRVEPDEAAGALAEAYREVEPGRYHEYVEVDGDQLIRAVLLLEGDRLEAHTNSVERMERVAARLEGLLDGAELVEEERRSQEELLVEGEGPAPVPSEELPPEVREAVRRHVEAWEERWVDEPVPALGGLTPREALDDPTRRQDLLALLREMERRREGLEGSGFGMDPERIRRRLGLEERR